MPENKEFMELTRQMQEIHHKKNNDYTSGNPDENFERMGIISSWFSNQIDKVFATMVAVKLARLGVLLSSQREPNNESVEDSFLDLCTYCALWAANYKRRNRRPIISELEDILNMPGHEIISDKHSEDSLIYKGFKVLMEKNEEYNKKSDPRIAEIFDIADKLTEDKLALLTAEARRLVM